MRVNRNKSEAWPNYFLKHATDEVHYFINLFISFMSLAEAQVRHSVYLGYVKFLHLCQIGSKKRRVLCNLVLLFIIINRMFFGSPHVTSLRGSPCGAQMGKVKDSGRPLTSAVIQLVRSCCMVQENQKLSQVSIL